MAQEVVGSVVSVEGQTQLTREGAPYRLAPEVSILSGDIVVTGATGTVQLEFRDETRVVVGPGSQFVAADIRMRRSGRASRFTITTVGGTFRFLSGNSAKRVYDIRTPTATMGVRGTEFDFALGRGRETTLVTFLGEVLLCGAGRRCYAVSGSCATVRAAAGGVDPTPIEAGAQAALLSRQFPFTQSQDRLAGRFRTSLAGCDDEAGSTGTVRPAVVREVSSTPAGSSGSDNDDDGGGGGSSSGGGNGGGSGGGSGGGGPRSGG